MVRLGRWSTSWCWTGVMVNGTEQLRRRKRRLFERQEGRCFWCHCTMDFGVHRLGRYMPPNLATIDHLDDRFSPERGRHAGEQRTVLACWKCNNDRSIKRHAEIPKEELRRRSGRYPIQDEA